MDTNNRQTFFNECYKNYYQPIYNYLLKKTGDPHISNDLCQEVFLRFNTHIEKIAPPAAYKWLRSTARLILYTHTRDSSINYEDPVGDIAQLKDDSLEYCHIDYDLSIMLKDIREALPPLDRSIYECKNILLLTNEKTAAALGITTRQVRYRSQLIKKFLVSSLNRSGIRGPHEILFFFLVSNYFLSIMSHLRHINTK